MQLPSIIGFESNVNFRNDLVAESEPFEAGSFFRGLTPEVILPQCSCGAGPSTCSCGKGPDREVFIYAFGDIKPVLPSLSVEKEFYNVAVTDPADKLRPFGDIAYKYLSRTENLYIARDVNWVFTIRKSIDLYIVDVGTDRDLSVLIETIAPRDYTIDYDILIGIKTAQTRRESTTGTLLPVVKFQQIYNITLQQYANAIIDLYSGTPKPTFDQASLIFGNALQLTDNTGDADKYRALNFIVLRYIKFYEEVFRLKYVGEPPSAGLDAIPYDLVSVSANPTEVFGKKKLIEIVFSFQGLTTSSIKTYSCTVDISGEFPFILIHWAVYYRGI